MRIIPIKRLPLAKTLWMNSFISIFLFQSEFILDLEKKCSTLTWSLLSTSCIISLLFSVQMEDTINQQSTSYQCSLFQRSVLTSIQSSKGRKLNYNHYNKNLLECCFTRFQAIHSHPDIYYITWHQRRCLDSTAT